MFDRWIEDGLLKALEAEGLGCISFSPLCQGILTDKYLGGMPDDSRAGKWKGQLYWGDSVTPQRVAKVEQLNKLAKARGQTMAQMAIAWVLRHPGMTSALVGASRVGQIEEAVGALNRLDFDEAELKAIDAILAG